MTDDCAHPCIQESEQFEELLLNFERQAQEMEEIAMFEKQVTARCLYVAKHGRAAGTAEAADLAGLGEHGVGAKLLNARCIDSYNAEQRSSRSRHR